MGKHSLPANIMQPPTPGPGLKLVRFWTPTWRCVSNTLVTNWRRCRTRESGRVTDAHMLRVALAQSHCSRYFGRTRDE